VLPLAVAIATSGATALAARSPSLSIAVPAQVRPNERYQIVIRVTYDARSMRAPYLVSFLQYAGAACKSAAGAESALGKNKVDGYFAGRVSGSPFSRTDNWKAGNMTGRRQVCAYLYRRPVSHRSRWTLLASASRFFQNL
jgi:hypothetical protein